MHPAASGPLRVKDASKFAGELCRRIDCRQMTTGVGDHRLFFGPEAKPERGAFQKALNGCGDSGSATPQRLQLTPSLGDRMVRRKGKGKGSIHAARRRGSEKIKLLIVARHLKPMGFLQTLGMQTL